MILRPNSCGSATTHGPFKNHLHLFMGPKENKGGLSGKNRVVSSIASLQIGQKLMDSIYAGQNESSGNWIAKIVLVAKSCVRSGAASISSPSFDFPLGPPLGSALREVKAFGPWAERLLGQQLFASGAVLLAIFLDWADTVGEGLIWGQFDRV
jgi:hypothetical protein